MTTPRNSIRKQRLLIQLEDEAHALQLRPRLSDINRDSLLPIIEQVLDELAVPGQRIKIDRLTVDLGTLSFERFAEEARQRLEAALRQRLGDIVFEAEHGGTGDTGSQTTFISEPEHYSTVQVLEHYLVNGVLPWHTHDKQNFSCETTFLKLAEEQQDALVEIIVRHHRLPRVIERLVFQLREDSLRKLLQLLEPHNADLILAYIFDLGVTHTLNPVLPVNAREFDRLVWMLTLTYSVRERGTQFNRKSYLKSLIHGMAQREGLQYRDMVAALHLGLKKIIKTRPLKSTLPALIATLAQEKSFAREEGETVRHGSDADTGPNPIAASPLIRDNTAIAAANAIFQRYDRFDLLRYYLEHGTLYEPSHDSSPDPALNANDVVAFLLQFSPQWVKALFKFNDEQHQWRAIVRAVTALPETELLLLLKKLFPLNNTNDNPFHAAVREVAQQAKNKTHFYSRVLNALFNHRALDLEQFANSVDIPTLAISAEMSQASRPNLKANFLETLHRFFEADSQTSDSVFPTDASNLLQSLFADSAAEARQFILDIQATPELREKEFNGFLKQISNQEFEQLLDLAQPEITGVSKCLTDLLASIPVPYRPGIGTLRGVILAQTIRFERAPPEIFFSNVLRALFPTPLSKPLADHLLSAADQWQRDDRLTEEQRNGFRTAIHRCVTVPPTANPADDNSTPWNTEPDFTHWQNRVFSTLLPDRILRQSKYVELRKLAAISRDRLPGAINRLLMHSPERFGQFVREHIVHPTVREYWTDILPESSLVRFIWLLEPQQLRALLASAETLAAAWLDAGGRAKGTDKAERRALWLFLLEFFAGHSGANCTLSAMTSSFFDHFSINDDNLKNIENDTVQLVPIPARSLLDKARHLASVGGQNQLLAVIHEDRSLLLAGTEEREQAKKVPRKRKPSTHPRAKSQVDANDPEDAIYIGNAGLALLSPFLPHLFKSLDMLHTNTEGKIRMRDKSTFGRAVHMLQYLVDGSTASPEPLLVLNKILCGESVHATIERGIELGDTEIQICDQLLKAAITNWSLISNTSVEGLRQTFLQREGRLEKTDNGWKLIVQRKTVDILIDQIPWSFSVVSHAWMPEMLYVSW